jgi:hypothetical protein
MRIELTYGVSQKYRCRCPDITVRGLVDGATFPVAAAYSILNGGPKSALYIEQEPDAGIDWVNGYKSTPAELRCREQGEFCVEISGSCPGLKRGANEVAIHVRDGAGKVSSLIFRFDWNPEPLPLPLDLRDLRGFTHIQDVGQAVNGAFDLDLDRNVIRSRSPVAPDALLVIGSPHQSQEATYAIRFLELAGAKWLGCSDFFAGLVEGVPNRGIRVGWCSAGMAALSPSDGARSFLAWGDHSGDSREWAIATHPAASVKITRNAWYRVRHQIALEGSNHRVRWKLWRDGQPEPTAWLCEEDSGKLPDELPHPAAASFALFQHMGHSIEWSDIVVNQYRPEPDDAPCRDPSRSRAPFLKRVRPGSF